MLSKVKEFKMNIRFNLIASKFVCKAVANKFNLAYAALEELKITTIRRNLKMNSKLQALQALRY